ncbi:acyl-ACP--UDP-N-acetylglucosamine O-acyltransferase [Microscilla marina]|uniref:Acyl-acyl-carrier-protein--UDP-N-acetylglucosamine O-acyltransferase n=1 Tax=Microscilla marina ATCC 23134 TaxID=313606 RepID=A1ZM11_MICM2|nr:acyl-ACP--UDP-N-acetylglucosamine O-acyltransferase [Microscilla marina]EAY28543.1 acyl-acyl-carrier-protein--UDP-N-acetylglucosamine O-acyltransferase [Microscilla marina ATCC 23134]
MKNNSLSYIHPNAKIGENVVIEPFVAIYDNVEIGDGTWIGANTVIMSGARIGKNCKVHPGAVISNIPQDLKFEGEDSLAVIGDNTIIRECATINRGTKYADKTQIGNNCLIMAYVHVAHDCLIGDNCILSNSVQVAGHVEIGYHAIVSGNSAVHQFSKIGSHVMVSGGSLVRKDVPPFVTAAREPLSYVGVNSIGLERRGFTKARINAIQDTYRIIFQSGLNTTKALNLVKEQIPESPDREEIIKFIQSSDRGIMKGIQ